MCGGVYVDQASVGRYEVSVLWTVGTDHGSPIITFIVQAEDRFNTGVWTTVSSRYLFIVMALWSLLLLLLLVVVVVVVEDRFNTGV